MEMESRYPSRLRNISAVGDCGIRERESRASLDGGCTKVKADLNVVKKKKTLVREVLPMGREKVEMKRLFARHHGRWMDG